MGVNDKNVTLENVRIIWRNFAGEEKQFNAAGDRNFALVLPRDVAEAMQEDGWRIKQKPPREEGDEPLYVLSVKVHFGGRTPPRIIMITSRGRNQLDEDLCGMLDWADLETVDLIIRPYDWTVNGNTGRKAYLHAIYATVHEDELELKYANIPDSEFSPDDFIDPTTVL